MAYSEKDLSTEWIPQVRFPDGNNVNLMTVRDAVSYTHLIDQTVYVELFDDTKGVVVGKFEIDRLMNLDDEEVKNAMQRISQMDIQ